MAYFRLVLGTLLLLTLSTTVQATPLHIVNAAFDPNEWTVSATDGTPARVTVTAKSFNVGGPNGAFLYVEQTNNGDPVPLPPGPSGGNVGNELKLMYDFVNGTNTGDVTIDVFFQVPKEQKDYAVHFGFGGQLQEFEKPAGMASRLNSDGSLNLDASPWVPIDPLDQTLAHFVGAFGFGISPNSSIPHFLAEFELSVDNLGKNNVASDGLYSPEPAFWSASTSPRDSASCRSFPFPRPCTVGPISSAFFILNLDGTITVDPVLGPNGGPIIQPVPQPTTLVLFSSALMGLWFCRRRQGKA